MIHPVSDPLANDSKDWRAMADCTFTAATYLFEHPNPFVSAFPASLLGHHALEMLLKSALVEAGMTIDQARVRKTSGGTNCTAYRRSWRRKANFLG
jgi:hypothetical protein